ncbi:hypothetical protein GOODEAATRI_007591 [Goodea atripinnis]|uniref:Uncharacterized protein n=1 Tax=Goodea atripinnis TaxID=208336 RepID=A0ABV0P2C1_9TELE
MKCRFVLRRAPCFGLSVPFCKATRMTETRERSRDYRTALVHLCVCVRALGAAMDLLDFSRIRHFQEREFDRKVDYRAEKREYLRGRNNVTSCRSPTRELDTRQIKKQLKEKRQLEFLRRRSVSPEPRSSGCIICSTDEALWREETLKKKLAVLTEISKNLVNSSDVLWTLSRAREVELRMEVASLRQEKQELQYNICLLEEDNQTLREEIQNFQDGGDESQNFFIQERNTADNAEIQLTISRDCQVEEELRLTQEKLQLKEKEVNLGQDHNKLKYILTLHVLVGSEAMKKKYYN